MTSGRGVFVFICVGAAIVMTAIVADRMFNHSRISEKLGFDKSDTGMPDREFQEVEEVTIIEEDMADCRDCIFPNEMLETYAPEQTSSKYSDLQGY